MKWDIALGALVFVIFACIGFFVAYDIPTAQASHTDNKYYQNTNNNSEWAGAILTCPTNVIDPSKWDSNDYLTVTHINKTTGVQDFSVRVYPEGV